MQFIDCQSKDMFLQIGISWIVSLDIITFNRFVCVGVDYRVIYNPAIYDIFRVGQFVSVVGSVISNLPPIVRIFRINCKVTVSLIYHEGVVFAFVENN